jgi:hypothetical protein
MFVYETKKEIKERELNEVKEQLKAILPPGKCVYMTLSQVSRSGMSRTIKCLTTSEDGSLRNISWLVAAVTDNKLVEGYNGGVRVGGCGMDMGLALADQISYALYEKPVDQRPHSALDKDRATGGVRYQWL